MARFFFFFFMACFYLFIYLFFILVALGLHCCAWTSSTCGERELLSSCGAWASHCRGFSCRRAQVLEHRLHGLVASGHVGSSWSWD